jgi:hypothetical protein
MTPSVNSEYKTSNMGSKEGKRVDLGASDSQDMFDEADPRRFGSPRARCP